ERLRSIINRTAQLEFKIVDDGTPYMQKLAQKVNADPAATEAGIKVEPDSWTSEAADQQHSDYYLRATDRKKFLAREEADSFGCNVKDKVPVDGKYECLVTGRTLIQEYLKGLGDEFKADDEHQMGYEEVTPRSGAANLRASAEKSWRSYYMHRTAELTGTAV